MKATTFFLLGILTIAPCFGQTLTGKELLEKSISYHDPDHSWETFTNKLFVTMETPNSADRNSEIHIDLPKQYFYIKATKDTISTEYTLKESACTITFNGKENPSEQIKQEHKLSCERATMYRDYYTYLYGLPMKLKDKGTILDPKVESRKFKGKEYLVLKATYEKAVGKDTWYFYFNPKNYAMEIYQFFHDEAKKDGEYILLTKEEIIHNIKMPKYRAWYMNKDDVYLGKDILKSSF